MEFCTSVGLLSFRLQEPVIDKLLTFQFERYATTWEKGHGVQGFGSRVLRPDDEDLLANCMQHFAAPALLQNLCKVAKCCQLLRQGALTLPFIVWRTSRQTNVKWNVRMSNLNGEGLPNAAS